MKFRKYAVSFGAGATIAVLIIILLPAYVGVIFASHGDNFVFVDAYASSPYVTTVWHHTGIMLPYGRRDLVGGIYQLFTAVDRNNIETVSSVVHATDASGVVSYVSENFNYNESWRTSYRPLRESLMPTELLTLKTGVCGDYAFFYAAALLPIYSSVTVRFIEPMGSETIGHVYVMLDNTAFLYKGVDSSRAEIVIWEQAYRKAFVFDVVLTYVDGEGVISTIDYFVFSNNTTVTYPVTITQAVITYVVGGSKTRVVTSIVKIVPPVVGLRTYDSNGTIVVDDSTITYFLSNSFFGAVSNSYTIFISYRGWGETRFFYSVTP